ncbi:uncharacterized protein EDB93DRAFT_1107984 [Suillus bovinus]|uniref:uncharacterized protein n=1 Tax=Suillus bovinus TaxID=48563 RepID=UPI001B867840|nr:uncharacterized protein EDB93DRAFT_1107984 [Suillus bovinus]KAG2132154.1 hypothetical protein EDB93DRAFT_1107984 [Suillus bovinus]
MPVTGNLTSMALATLYSKLSKSSNSLHNQVPKDTELQDKQIFEDLKTAIKSRLGVQFTDLDNQGPLSLGHFDFNNKDASTFAEGTLHPTLQMGDVERMLANTAKSLKGYIVSLMEGMGLEASVVKSAHDSHPVFEPSWGAALNSISSAIYLTAYCHYLDWCNHKYDKRKSMHVGIQQPSGSESTSSTTNATSLSSIPTTSSSSDPTTCTSSSMTSASSSTGLSFDAQPERSAKKSKFQPEGEGSKGTPKKEAQKVPSPIFPTKTESDSNCEDSDNESTTHPIDTRSSDKFKAQLVLNATRAQRNVCLAEKTLADCVVQQNIVLGRLYQFEATEAGRKLEDADINIGYVRHSVRKIGITLLEDFPTSKP